MWNDMPLWPESASTVSGEVDRLYIVLLALSAFFGLLITALVIGFAVKYRRRPGVPAANIEGSLRLELVWTIIPFLIVMGIFAWGTKLFLTMSRAPRDVMDVYVVGKQWMWKLQHAQGQREINELHVPIGRTVRLTMTSEDVIHSFYVPAFRVKKDVVPGRYSSQWFEATKPGTYHLFCAEYCGAQHSEMIGWVHAMEPQDYERWLSGSLADEPPEETGRKLFESLRCDTCHKDASAPVDTLAGGVGGGARSSGAATPGSAPTGAPSSGATTPGTASTDGTGTGAYAGAGGRGPSLHGLFGRPVTLKDGSKVVANEDYIRESMLKPLAKIVQGFDPIMPTYEGQIGEEQILQILAYIKTLRETK